MEVAETCSTASLASALLTSTGEWRRHLHSLQFRIIGSAFQECYGLVEQAFGGGRVPALGIEGAPLNCLPEVGRQDAANESPILLCKANNPRQLRQLCIRKEDYLGLCDCHAILQWPQLELANALTGVCNLEYHKNCFENSCWNTTAGEEVALNGISFTIQLWINERQCVEVSGPEVSLPT